MEIHIIPRVLLLPVLFTNIVIVLHFLGFTALISAVLFPLDLLKNVARKHYRSSASQRIAPMTKAIDTFNKILRHQQRICLLATSGAENSPNSAIFGAVKVRDESILIAMGDNLSYKNLQLNPSAQLTAFIPGPSPPLYRGIRLNLHFEEILEQGELFETMRIEVKANAGDQAAAMIKRIIVLSVCSHTPLINLENW